MFFKKSFHYLEHKATYIGQREVWNSVRCSCQLHLDDKMWGEVFTFFFCLSVLLEFFRRNMYYLHNQYKGNSYRNAIKEFHKIQFLKMYAMLLRWEVKNTIFHLECMIINVQK